ncbi:MAG: c-type cytochrome domain-containing protein [Betaproteobacteria bacterium]
MCEYSMSRILKSTVGASQRAITLLCYSAVAAYFLMTPRGGLAESPSKLETDEPGYRQTVSPFFKQHCLRCHGPEDQQADLRVDQNLPNDFLDVVAKGKWGEVVNVLNSHEMPPED